MQQFAADVQRQIGGVDHTFDESQVGRHQGLCVVHDENTFDIQLQSRLFVAVEQIHWRFGWDVEQLGVFGAALNAVMGPSQRRFEVMADVFVELEMLFVRNIFLGTCPQRVGLVDGFPFVSDHHFARLVLLAFLPHFFAHADGQ